MKAKQLALAFVVVSVIEAPILHGLLFAFEAPGWTHAVALYALVSSIVFVVGDLRLLLESNGHRLAGDNLEIRCGSRVRGEVPLAAISSIEQVSDWQTRKQGWVRATAGERPNLILHLAEPVELHQVFLRRRARAVVLSVAEPERLERALVGVR